MTPMIRRYATNYIAGLIVLFGLAIGLDWLLMHVGRPPIVGCLLRPVLYLLLSRTIAIWLISAGLLMLLFARTRSVGINLTIIGLIIGLLPALLEVYLAPLCHIR